LDDASVRLLSVVLLPADGLPTRPMSGSRGMWDGCAGGGSLAKLERLAGGQAAVGGDAPRGCVLRAVLGAASMRGVVVLDEEASIASLDLT
jgi:hypothetical protein